MGFAIELARTSVDPDKAFGRIKTELTRLTTLVGELLQVTRVEGDPSTRNRQPVLMDDLIRSVVSDCTIEAEARQCRIEYAGGVHSVVMGDTELLRRAVENVLRNAVRHTPEYSAVLVSLEEQDGYVEFSVRDHGTGVPDHMLSDIFKPFFRVESDRNRASGGAGLGLAIAERAIRAHGGEIRAANSNPGLRVSIRLPRDPDNSAPNGTLQNLSLPNPAEAGLTNLDAAAGSAEKVKIF
jgi:two-component system sensor histidine kinase CpxA